MGWEEAGFFERIWQAGLAEYDDMQGISVDGALMKAPLAQQAVGPNPTDRGKKGSKRYLLVDARAHGARLAVRGCSQAECDSLSLQGSAQRR
jgi:putative transposase